MSDKQIIVNEVDVSGCIHYKNKSCIADYYLTDVPFDEAKCELNPNCYYKQLKRKEKERKKLTKNYFLVTQQRNAAEQQLDQLKAEKDRLKATLTKIKEMAEPYRMTINKICGNCKKYDSCHACCYKDINCYKYTSSKTNACEEFTYLDKLIPNILARQILQKISECEGNNE